MYTCLNKFRDLQGNIIGYTLISYMGVQYIQAEELRNLLKEHKIYVSNLVMEKDRIIDYNSGIQKACDYINTVMTKDHWVPGGLMKCHKLDYLNEFYTKFDMLVSDGDRFAKNIEGKFNIGYTKIYYYDTMDSRWVFNNGVTIILDKMIGKLIVYGYGEKFELGETPIQIIETKLFGGYTK